MVFIWRSQLLLYKEDGKDIEKSIEKLKIPFETYACEILDEDAMCFGEKSEIFSDKLQKDFAKNIARSYGKKIAKSMPLGYGNLELAVTFEYIVVQIILFQFCGESQPNLSGYHYLKEIEEGR